MSRHVQSVKEVVRHLAFGFGLSGCLDLFKTTRGLKVGHLKHANTSDRFREIYRLGVWVHRDNQDARSGLGSELAATDSVRSQLIDILSTTACGRLLDVGCGDWTWMQNVALPCNYLGIDVVPEVIAANQAHEREGVAFQLLDAIRDPLPKADVALCREVLFHLSFEDGLKVLANIKRSAKWLIATTDDTWFNSNIRTGDYRPLNLRQRPFVLPAPQQIIQDHAVFPGRTLGVWPCDQIPG